MNNPLKDKRDIAIALLVVLFLLKAPLEGRRFIWWVLAGLSLSAALDIFINRMFFRIKIIPRSAVITGFITSGVLDYNQPWHILGILISLAIISKHLIKFRGRHIFNPANLSLFAATVFKIPLTWNIESNNLLIIAIGLYLAYNYKKFFLIAGFLMLFTALFSLSNVAPFSVLSWFFVFVMLIEPKTSGYGALRGFIFGGVAGAASFLVFQFLPGLDYFVTALFLANLLNPFLGSNISAVRSVPVVGDI